MPKKEKETPISSESTVSQSTITKNCTDSKRGVAQYVYDTLKSLTADSRLTTTIRLEKYEDSFVITATTESSGVTQTVTFYDGWLNTSKGKLDGSLPKRK